MINISYVDAMFAYSLEDILIQEWENDNRAKWADGSPVQTKRILQNVRQWDLSKGFPILTLREINWKAAIDEIIWIYMKQSNNVNDLSSKIWNSWKDENGDIKKAYGYQIAKPTMGFPNQMDYVLNEIITNPTSRRIQMNMFSAEDQYTKAKESLIECAYATQFSVKDGKLHMTLIQRSGDALTAANFGGWNTVQYAFLQHAIAKECNLDVGKFTHFVQDLHLYNKHEPQAEELLNRWYEAKPYELPTIKIADKPFYELTTEDVELIGYKHHGKIDRLDVAI